MSDRDLKTALASFDDDFKRVKEAAKESKGKKKGAQKTGKGGEVTFCIISLDLYQFH